MYIKAFKYRLMEDKKFQSVSKTKQSVLPILKIIQINLRI